MCKHMLAQSIQQREIWRILNMSASTVSRIKERGDQTFCIGEAGRRLWHETFEILLTLAQWEHLKLKDITLHCWCVGENCHRSANLASTSIRWIRGSELSQSLVAWTLIILRRSSQTSSTQRKKTCTRWCGFSCLLIILWKKTRYHCQCTSYWDHHCAGETRSKEEICPSSHKYLENTQWMQHVDDHRSPRH